jgi:mevalonate kinase
VNALTTASAPGKIILFGEHAVVYARPAIAVPVSQVHADAAVEPWPELDVLIDAPDIARQYNLTDAAPDDPIASIIRLTCARAGTEAKHFAIRIHSTIPVARGLGSGAAVSVAVARALLEFLHHSANAEEVSALAYEVEKLYHGTPSGIDNTVIAFGSPVYYVRDRPFESFRVGHPFRIVIADTGIASPTRIAVGDVRRAWEADTRRFEGLFDEIGSIARAARTAIESGDIQALGPLMDANQKLAEEINVSSPQIETLVRAARDARAKGAKLSGAGRGGNIIALVDDRTETQVVEALRRAGAASVMVTEIR